MERFVLYNFFFLYFSIFEVAFHCNLTAFLVNWVLQLYIPRTWSVLEEIVAYFRVHIHQRPIWPGIDRVTVSKNGELGEMAWLG